MTKDKKTQDNKAEDQPVQDNSTQAQGLPVTVHAQYVRDLSFENPNAPESLQAGQSAPEMDVNIGMDARKLEDKATPNLYEVGLSVRAEAKRGEDVVFIAEILYGVTVSLGSEVPEDSHHPLLLIEIPKLAFPYVRKLLSDVTTDGGFPPLLLSPVDFQALYMQRFAQQAEEGKKEA
ncbi:protein-export chaperone SecB [Alphaproteobacteria bacterium]|nr:protein-export chaperone SecB [Alphaproteobacteria bacterium]